MRVGSLGPNIWRCRLAPEDIRCMKFGSQFWQDVMYSWSQYNYYHMYRIENQIIWYNSRVRINNKPIFWEDCYERNLVYVHQLFQEGKFFEDNEVMYLFKLSKMRYNSLKSALPQEWKEFFILHQKQEYLPVPPQNYDQMFLEENFSRKVYHYITGDLLLLQNKFVKWKKDLGVDICDDIVEFGKEHGKMYTLTNVTRFRSFQYRLLQRGLVTNILLCKWGIIESSKCSFCKIEEESVLHIMVLCREIWKIWCMLTSFLTERYGDLEVEINAKTVVLNTIVKPRNHVANFLCLLLKQFIYKQRCLGEPIHFPVFKMYINKIEKIEKYIAAKNGKMLKHESKWLRAIDQNGRRADIDGCELNNYIQWYNS